MSGIESAVDVPATEAAGCWTLAGPVRETRRLPVRRRLNSLFLSEAECEREDVERVVLRPDVVLRCLQHPNAQQLVIDGYVKA